MSEGHREHCEHRDPGPTGVVQLYILELRFLQSFMALAAERSTLADEREPKSSNFRLPLTAT